MEKKYDLVIIGSGPAGLAAAIYAQRARLNTLVIEKEMISGGQVLTTYEVENYPGFPGVDGFSLGTKFREHADHLGAEFVTDEIMGIRLIQEIDARTDADQRDGAGDLRVAQVEAPGDAEIVPIRERNREFGDSAGEHMDAQKTWKVLTGKKAVYLAKAVILASGATHKSLGVPGEERLRGSGVSYCATCDGAFFRKKEVAVVGGGDVALEDAIFLSRMCSRVYLIHRRGELRGAKVLQEQLMALENVTILWNTVVEEICGEQRVEELVLRNEKSKDHSKLPVSGVFVAVGIDPNSMIVGDLVRMDHGYVCAGETCETSVPGIFAAGDVRTKQLRQIVTAASDGANAVSSAERYLNAWNQNHR